MSDKSITANEIEIDIDALNRRYEEERQKRLRGDALSQYQELKGKFAHFAEDPHGDPNLKRDPVEDDVQVVVIGGGFGGLISGGRLREAGVKSIRVVERGADFGGTWYWNRYPGARCDVEAYIYLPMLEETGYVPTEKYAGAPEIFAHCQRIAKHYNLYDGALFQTVVTGVVWDEQRKRWIVSTNRGDKLAAQFVVSCKGLFTNPKLPGIPGIETFQGHSFHSSRWDYSYTGGESDGKLVNLKDKKVGVIGTGSTGIQLIPPLAEWAQQLYVFQRTPPSIDVRGNRRTDTEWWRTLEPGWQRKRMENFTCLTTGVPQPEDMVRDGWTDIIKDVSPPIGGEGAKADPAELQLAEMRKMESVRRRIDSIVADQATAEALKPYYHYFCKRPGFSDDYLPVYNQPNVSLVDTGGKGVERITPKGVVVAGREYEVDCLVYATGFDFMTEYTREAGFDIVGRGGVPLSEHWSTGARTLFGIQTHGFPNLFMINLLQAGISINYNHTAEVEAQYIAYVVGRSLKENIETVEPALEAENAWVDAIMAGAAPRRAFLEACIPGYYNYEGRRERAFELNEPYPGGPVAYAQVLEKWRREGRMEGLEARRAE